MPENKPPNKKLDKRTLDKLFDLYNVKEDLDLPDNMMEVRTVSGEVRRIKLHD